MRLIAQCSCSAISLRYFDWRSSLDSALSVWMRTLAVGLVPAHRHEVLTGTALARATQLQSRCALLLLEPAVQPCGLAHLGLQAKALPRAPARLSQLQAA